MHTLFLTDEKKNTLPRITDARVQAVVNDSQVFPMVRYTVKGYFEANYVPRPGDRIRIKADTRYGRAVGEDRLPQLVPVATRSAVTKSPFKILPASAIIILCA